MIKLYGGLKPTPQGNYLLCGTYGEKYFTAKISNSPSFEGINGSQITGLSICAGDKWDGNRREFVFDGGVKLCVIEASIPLYIVDQIESKFGLRRLEDNTCEAFARITPDEMKIAS